MKIAYISSSVIPSQTANSVHVMKMCQAFMRNKHQVTLFAQTRDSFRTDDDHAYYGVEEGFRILKVNRYRIKGHRYITAFKSALRLKKHKPDLVYGRSISGCLFSSWMGIKTIVELHQPPEEVNGLDKFFFNKLIRAKDLCRIIVISEALKKKIGKGYPLTNGKLYVAHDGADMSEKIEPHKFNNEKINVGYIGGLQAGKGMELIEQLVGYCSWACFHIVGGTEKDVKYWKDKLKDHKNTIFYGYLPPYLSERYRVSFDILLAPYQLEVFGTTGRTNISPWMSPLKIFEYMAAKKPIICSRLPVLEEVLKHNDNSILCEPDDPEEWIAALEKIRHDPDLARRIAENAFEDLKERYTWKKRAENVLCHL